MIKIPYGNSDFSDISTGGYYFVDRTNYIERLEQLGEKFLIFLRPRRFGKSLWISILQHYYGLEHRADFERLFGRYYIGRNPTSLANSYLVLRLEFSRIDTASETGTYQGFLSNVREGVQACMQTYAEYFPATAADAVLRETNPSEVLKSFFSIARNLPHKIYLLIDEYDHFANELVSFNLNYFGRMVAQNGFVRKFYETIKTATGEGIVDRIFITGVTPLTLDSLTSGFNIGSNLSLDRDLQAMLGFSEEEVADLLTVVGVPAAQRPAVLEQVRSWYNGYCFSTRPDNGGLYNPDMVLYYAKHYQRYQSEPEQMLDTNVASDYGKIRKLFQVGDHETDRFDILDKLLDQGRLSTQLTPEFSLEKPFSAHDFLSLLYYMGLLTIKGARLTLTEVGIPNEVIRKLYFDYFAHLIHTRLEGPPDALRLQEAILALAERNKPEPLLSIVAQTLGQLSNRDWLHFDEKHVKMVLVSYLYSTQLYLIKSEYESEQKYVDLLLLRRPSVPAPFQFAFELKFLHQKNAAALPGVMEEGREQLRGYLERDDLRQLEDLKAWLVVFVGAELRCLEEVEAD